MKERATKAIDLRGIWAGIAGVKFPEQTPVKKTRREPNPAPDPAKWISSTDAAKLAGCTRSFICALFRRRKVTRKFHRGEDGALRAYWKRSVADRIIGVYRGDVSDKKRKAFCKRCARRIRHIQGSSKTHRLRTLFHSSHALKKSAEICIR